MNYKKIGCLVISALTLTACNSNLSGFFGTQEKPLPQTTVNLPAKRFSRESPQTYAAETSPINAASQNQLSTPPTTTVTNSDMPGVIGTLPEAPKSSAEPQHTMPALYNSNAHEEVKPVKHARETVPNSSLPPLTHGKYNASGSTETKSKGKALSAPGT